MQTMQAQMIPTARGPLHCAIGPQSGPPMVLWHGVTRCGRDFDPILPALSNAWSLLAVDHRGHGESPRGSSYRVVDFAADAIAFIDTRENAAVLLGHSLGAMVAAVVAAERPAAVRALILEEPPGTTLADGFDESRFRLQFTNTARLLATEAASDVAALAGALAAMPVQRPSDGRVVPFRELRDPEALRFSAECLVRLDPGVLIPLTAGRWLEGLDWFSLLPRISCPVLLLRADPHCGGMLSENKGARITALIPDCTRIDLPGVSHSIHTREPARMAEIVTHFLQRIV